MASELTLGVIGGSGLYEMEGLTEKQSVHVDTPFGKPSDALVVGRLEGRRIVFLPRHGVGHRILPSEINYRANIWALKSLGVSQLLSISAVGSMKEAIVPGHLVFVDQFIDLTKRRISTFCGDGLVAHVPMAEPVCPGVRQALIDCAQTLGFPHHSKGTYVCVEGPQFSTRAESMVYRSWGVDVIGMTNMPEAKLAREAEIAYATVALATDYDCWHPAEASVTVEAVLETLAANVEKARALIRAYAARATEATASTLAKTALRTSLITPLSEIPHPTKERLAPLLQP
ncbi:MAG: S-methyl-5'-thioadenosine phosphorylase [Myxococcota bacterium]